MKKLTLNELQKRFTKVNPFGTIAKQSNNKYDVYFDSRDFRSESEKELDLWSISADKRKLYTYTAANLLQLAYKLKIDVTDFEETKLSKVNQEWEEWLKTPEEEIDLFA